MSVVSIYTVGPINSSIAQGNIFYITPGDTAIGSSPPTATEPLAALTYRTGGTFSFLSATVGFNTGTCAITLTFRVNSGGGNESLSLPATTTGVFTDTTDTDTIVSGNQVDYKLVVQTLSSAVGYIGTITQLFTATSSSITMKKIAAANNNNTYNSASTNYFNFNANPANGAATAIYTTKLFVTGTLTNFFVYIQTNSINGTTTMNSYVNGTAGNLSVSIAASGSGAFEDLSDTDTLSASGTTVQYVLVTGGSSGVITPINYASELTTTNNSFVFCGAAAGTTVTGTSTIHMTSLAGGGSAFPSADESWTQATMNSNFNLSNLTGKITANTTTAPSTLGIRVSGANGNEAASIASGTTGFFSDLSDSDVISSLAPVDVYYVASTGVGFFSLATWSFLNSPIVPMNIQNISGIGLNGGAITSGMPNTISII